MYLWMLLLLQPDSTCRERHKLLRVLDNARVLRRSSPFSHFCLGANANNPVLLCLVRCHGMLAYYAIPVLLSHADEFSLSHPAAPETSCKEDYHNSVHIHVPVLCSMRCFCKASCQHANVQNCTQHLISQSSTIVHINLVKPMQATLVPSCDHISQLNSCMGSPARAHACINKSTTACKGCALDHCCIRIDTAALKMSPALCAISSACPGEESLPLQASAHQVLAERQASRGDTKHPAVSAASTTVTCTATEVGKPTHCLGC